MPLRYGDDTKSREKKQISRFRKAWNEGEIGRFWGQKAASFALQSSLDCTSIQPRLLRNVGWIAPKDSLMEGRKEPFWSKEAAVAELISGYFWDKLLMIKGLFEINE